MSNPTLRKELFIVQLMIISLLLLAQGCAKIDSKHSETIVKIDLYYISPYTLTHVPITEESIEVRNDVKSKSIFDKSTLAKFDRYISFIKNQEVKKDTSPLHVDIMCKIFNRDGSVERISFMSRENVYFRKTLYIDKKRAFFGIIKGHLPLETGWHIFMKKK